MAEPTHKTKPVFDRRAPKKPPVQQTLPLAANPLEHFVDLVLAGRREGCSDGERKAAALAAAIVKYARWLDAKAIQGLKEFADLAAQYPAEAARVIQ